MLTSLLLPAIENLKLEKIETSDATVNLHLASTQMPIKCPGCGSESNRVHSRYTRRVADLPWAGTAVVLLLTVRRSRCYNQACAQRIFAERFGEVIPRLARRTSRLYEQLQRLALALGGELGGRIVDMLGMKVSPDTLLRLIRDMKIPTAAMAKVVGIDDFAMRKGHTYATILVDLEHHQPIDLLPDRETKTAVDSLQRQPNIEVITRDRLPAYAEACREAHPAAIQVADRFHLLQNCTDALQRVCERELATLREVNRQLADEQNNQPGNQQVQEQSPRPDSEAAAHARTELASPASRRFYAVKKLQQEGLSGRAIATQLQIDRRTVSKYMNLSVPPPKASRPRASCVEPYWAYLEQRVAEGCDNRTQLYLEVQKLGFGGRYHSVWRAVGSLLPKRGAVQPVQSKPPSRRYVLTPRKAAWLLQSDSDSLLTRRANALDLLLTLSPNLAEARMLALSFRTMVTQRKPEQLDAWLHQARNSSLPAFKHFAIGLQRDYAAVYAALDLPFSNGQVEGHNNRVKLIKRQMYGRAKFDLLRIRVLCRV
jgi:transposase